MEYLDWWLQSLEAPGSGLHLGLRLRDTNNDNGQRPQLQHLATHKLTSPNEKKKKKEQLKKKMKWRSLKLLGVSNPLPFVTNLFRKSLFQ